MAWSGSKFPARITLIDDRGRPQRAIPTHELDAPASLKDRVAEAPSLSDRLRLDQVIWYAVVSIGFVIMAFIAMQLGSGLLSQAVSTSFGFGFVVMVHFLRSRTAYAREVRQQQAAVFKSALRCPCCGYDLRRISPAADGCTECSECGAAWKLDPSRAIDDFSDLDVNAQQSDSLLSRFFIRRRSVKDALGRSVRLTHPIVALDGPRHWSDIDANVRKRLQRRLWCVGLAKRMVLLPIVVVLLYFWTRDRFAVNVTNVPAITSVHQFLDALWQFFSPIAALVIWAMSLWYIIKPDASDTKAMIDVWLDESLCPSCANPIDRGMMQQGEQARCPSCGSMWQRIGKATLHDAA